MRARIRTRQWNAEETARARRRAMTSDVLTTLPVRSGHFLSESGYHTNVWISLDLLFVNPSKIAPLVTSLAEDSALTNSRPSAVV